MKADAIYFTVVLIDCSTAEFISPIEGRIRDYEVDYANEEQVYSLADFDIHVEMGSVYSDQSICGSKKCELSVDFLSHREPNQLVYTQPGKGTLLSGDHEVTLKVSLRDYPNVSKEVDFNFKVNYELDCSSPVLINTALEYVVDSDPATYQPGVYEYSGRAKWESPFKTLPEGCPITYSCSVDNLPGINDCNESSDLTSIGFNERDGDLLFTSSDSARLGSRTVLFKMRAETGLDSQNSFYFTVEMNLKDPCEKPLLLATS